MIINFSHPLRPEAVAKLVEMFPGEDLADIKCQISFDEPFKPQITAIIENAKRVSGGEVTAYFAPSLSVIASVVAREIDAPIIMMKNVGDLVPCWMPTGELL
jgi:hypothetical protein